MYVSYVRGPFERCVGCVSRKARQIRMNVYRKRGRPMKN